MVCNHWQWWRIPSPGLEQRHCVMMTKTPWRVQFHWAITGLQAITKHQALQRICILFEKPYQLGHFTFRVGPDKAERMLDALSAAMHLLLGCTVASSEWYLPLFRVPSPVKVKCMNHQSHHKIHPTDKLSVAYQNVWRGSNNGNLFILFMNHKRDSKGNFRTDKLFQAHLITSS